MRENTMRSALLALALLSGPVQAEDNPKWELGAGVGLLSVPDYRGADHHKQYALPFPYLVYRGAVVQIDRDKARGLLYKSERSEWDISVGRRYR